MNERVGVAANGREHPAERDHPDLALYWYRGDGFASPSTFEDRGALRDHDRAAVELEAAARVVWRTMTVGQEPDPLGREKFRETLERLELLGPVREEMIRAFGTQPAVVRRADAAGGAVPCPHPRLSDHEQGDRRVPCLRVDRARCHGNAACGARAGERPVRAGPADGVTGSWCESVMRSLSRR